MTKEQRSNKEINTRKYKQQIENLKLDIIDNQAEFDKIYDNFKVTVDILEVTIPSLKGKIKYDTEKRVKLLRELYNFKYNEWK